MEFEITKNSLEGLKMAKTGCNTILGEGVDSIVDVKATKGNHPVGTTK